MTAQPRPDRGSGSTSARSCMETHRRLHRPWKLTDRRRERGWSDLWPPPRVFDVRFPSFAERFQAVSPDTKVDGVFNIVIKQELHIRRKHLGTHGHRALRYIESTLNWSVSSCGVYGYQCLRPISVASRKSESAITSVRELAVAVARGESAVQGRRHRVSSDSDRPG